MVEVLRKFGLWIDEMIKFSTFRDESILNTQDLPIKAVCAGLLGPISHHLIIFPGSSPSGLSSSSHFLLEGNFLFLPKGPQVVDCHIHLNVFSALKSKAKNYKRGTNQNKAHWTRNNWSTSEHFLAIVFFFLFFFLHMSSFVSKSSACKCKCSKTNAKMQFGAKSFYWKTQAQKHSNFTTQVVCQMLVEAACSVATDTFVDFYPLSQFFCVLDAGHSRCRDSPRFWAATIWNDCWWTVQI